MQVEYTGRQVTVTDALRELGDEGISRIGKILGRLLTAHVVLTAEKYRQTAEITVTTRWQSLVGACESTNMETALREALAKVESQAIRYKDRMRAKKRKPKEAKTVDEPELVRNRNSGRPGTTPPVVESLPVRTRNGNGRPKPMMPVTVHSFPAKTPVLEPHVVRSIDAVALRPMTLEEAVKEAEFQDREVFVFRDSNGNLKVLHRKRDGKMELIETA